MPSVPLVLEQHSNLFDDFFWNLIASLPQESMDVLATYFIIPFGASVTEHWYNGWEHNTDLYEDYSTYKI